MTVPYTFATTPAGSNIPLSRLDDNFDALGSSANASFLQSGTSAVERTVQAKLRDIVSVKDFGAVGDGVTDDTAAFNAAFAASQHVLAPAGSYKIKNVDVSSGKTLTAYGAYFFDITGASYIFKLSGFSARLVGAYISSATNCSEAAIVVGDAKAAVIESVRIVNSTTGIKLSGTASLGCTRTQLSNVWIDAFSVDGIYIGPNAAETQAVNVYIDANSVASVAEPAKGMPKPNTYGIRYAPAGSTIGFGGHSFANTTCINTQTGLFIDGGELSKFVNCIFDGCSGAGVALNNASLIDFGDAFIGTCGRAISLTGTTLKVSFTGLNTRLTGVIPPWGGSDFFTSSGISPIGNDLYAANTAQAVVDAASWCGDSRNVNLGASTNIDFTGAIFLPLNSVSTVAAGSTVYLGNTGQSASEESQVLVLPFDVYSVSLLMYCGLAPGAGQSFTYTLRSQFADTTFTAATNGAGVFSSSLTGTRVALTKGNNISVELTTSASAAATVHRGYLLLIPNK